MTLIRTSLLNSIAVGVRILTTLILNKIFAVYVGPAGYAVIGQFQNFVNMLVALASGAVNTGVTKYTAEYYDDEARQVSVWRTAGTIALVGSIGTGLLIALLQRFLAGWILKDPAFAGVFVWLGAGLVLFTLNGLLLAILNGKKEVNRYVVANIAGSLVGLGITGGLAVWRGLYGALVALAINQSIVFAVTLALCWRTPWFHLRNLAGRVEPTALKSLGRFSLMAVAAAACAPAATMVIRSHLGATFGMAAAGQWEALTRLSGLYLLVVTNPLTIYYLPRISEIRDPAELRLEIRKAYRFLLPVAVASAIALYLLRDLIVVTLFTAKFAPMRDLFAWQMAGDVVKTAGFLLTYVLLGKAMVTAYVTTEIVFAATWVGLVWLMTGWFGLQGAQIAYFVNYVLYWGVMAVLVVRHARSVQQPAGGWSAAS
jgi:PST family polysaccharide transporter